VRVALRGVAYSHDLGGTPVLRDLDLDVATGTIHAVVGPNGCGKTTLLRLIAGLAEPERGTIDFIGERRHDNLTAFVFQEPRLLPHWTVERNIAIGPEFGSRPPSIYEKVRDFYTRQVGLTRARHAKPDALSLGQQTMAGLGRGLAHDAEVVLLDEPFAHIDALQKLRMREELETAWQLDPVTVVMVTHDVEEAVSMADHVSVMSARPGPMVAEVDVLAPRPRSQVALNHHGLLDAFARVWEALEAS
jgi:ABC-type nitrate/sulfonate/bicarbonate transport system ATPase subunit